MLSDKKTLLAVLLLVAAAGAGATAYLVISQKTAPAQVPLAAAGAETTVHMPNPQGGFANAARLSLSPLGVAGNVTYRFIPSTGVTVATGVTTNFGACGANPTTYSISLVTNASTTGCASSIIRTATLNPAIDMFFNTAYTVDTNVSGNWYYGRFTEDDGACTNCVVTFRLIYVYPNGTIVSLPGTASQAIPQASDANYNVSLANISGIVPTGAKLGLRISQVALTTIIYFGDTANTSGNGPSGVFSINDQPVAGLPDLNITNNDIALNNSSPYENDTVQINATFRNSGTADATNVNITYYVNNSQQCSFIVPSMPAGATNTTTCNWTPTTQGNYTVLVALDPANTIQESNKTNNNASANVTVQRRLPDLMMNSSSIALNNTTIYENDIVQINATIFNIGNATAANVNVSYYINTTLQCSFSIPSLPVGASNTTSCNWNATTFGNYTITVALDPANTIQESNKTNNNASANVTVNRRLPDLMMNASSLSLNNTNPITGDVVQINATVYNIGNATASNVNITYYAINATNATATLCSFIIPSLTVGSSNTTTCNWTASTAGTFNITAAADPGNTIPETNESNNNASTLVSVGARTSLTIFDATDTANIPPNVQITFYANYTTVPAGGPVTGAACAISIPSFNITANMTYNATSALYQYNTSFAQPGAFTWNATCSRAGFQTQSANKSFTVTSFAFVVTDKASYSNCNSVYYKISLFNLTDGSADDALTVRIIDALGATRQSVSNYTSGGAYSGIYAFTPPLVTGTWTIKANTSCVLRRQNFTAGEGDSDIWKIDVLFSPDQGGYASGTTITINSYVYNLHGVGVAGLGTNVSANVDGGSVALTDNGLGRYTASYLTASTGAHYFEARAINGAVNVTNRRGFFVR